MSHGVPLLEGVKQGRGG